jgi:acyl carrier protein
MVCDAAECAADKNLMKEPPGRQRLNYSESYMYSNSKDRHPEEEGDDSKSNTFHDAMFPDDGHQYPPFVKAGFNGAAAAARTFDSPMGAQSPTEGHEGKVFTAEDEKRLLEALKRCSAPTRAAACAYRRTRDADHLTVIVHGLIEHYVERDARTKLSRLGDDIRLVEDLAIDSLTMLEIVFLAEEVLQVSIDNEELRTFRTVGEIKRFIVSKLAPAPRLS